MPYLPDNDTLKVPPWLKGACDELMGMVQRRHSPQALLVHGLPGTGRRYLSLWLAARLLGVPGGRFARFAEAGVGQEADPELGHPDLMLLQPLPEKTTIPVESIRDLIAFLQLKSHQGGARVAVIWPADVMTAAAANSLLKTLEEPPRGSAIILVASVPARLPPTVLSRCHKFCVAPPVRVLALEWLAGQGNETDWGALLDLAGGAPLQALALHRDGFSSQITRYVDDLEQLRQRRESPASVARKWSSAHPDFLARWLYFQAATSVEQVLTTSADSSGIRPLQKSVKPTSIQLSFERLSDAELLYRNRAKSVGVEIQLAALLQRWYGETANGDES